MRKLWDSFWQLSKSERIGMSILLLLLLAWLSADLWLPQKTQAPVLLSDELAAFLAEQAAEAPLQSEADTALPEVTYFYFDINQADPADLMKLGLSPKAIAGLMRYRSKGGKVRNLQDFDKLFSLTDAEKDRLRPWLRIAAPSNETARQETASAPTSKAAADHKAVFELVDVNLADSATLIKVPGIGPAFASRIIRYRERLGGFVQNSQLMEVYGVDSTRYEQWQAYLKMVSGVVRQININYATETELAAHPYISKNLARRLLSYREQHGVFKSPTDLSKLHGVQERNLLQLLPYISVEELQPID